MVWQQRFSIRVYTNIVPIDEKLSLRWFDAEGCIEGISFDFVKRLPLFVLMVMIFQRFSPRALGLSQRDATRVVVNNQTFDIEERKQLFQLFGRRTFGSPASLNPHGTVSVLPDEAVINSGARNEAQSRDPNRDQPFPILEEHSSGIQYLLPENTNFEERLDRVKVMGDAATPVCASHLNGAIKRDRQATVETTNGANTSPVEKPLFFKSSWKENSRSSEPDIIETAHKRAKDYLKEYSRMVTNHIPEVNATEACSSYSTSKIRLFFKDVGGNQDLSKEYIKQHGRTRMWMVTRKLKPITELQPDDFWKVFWDIVRCV